MPLLLKQRFYYFATKPNVPPYEFGCLPSRKEQTGDTAMEANTSLSHLVLLKEAGRSVWAQHRVSEPPLTGEQTPRLCST